MGHGMSEKSNVLSENKKIKSKKLTKLTNGFETGFNFSTDRHEKSHGKAHGKSWNFKCVKDFHP